MAYTRDQWLEKCAARFRDKAQMEPGEAARYAITMHEQVVKDDGRTPSDWSDPIEIADEEISLMCDDGDGDDAAGSDV